MARSAIAVACLSLVLAACSAPAPDEQTAATEQSQAAAAAAAEPAPADPTGAAVPQGGCDDTQAQWIIGKTPTPAEQDQAGKDAGATTVRSLKPGEAATMEFNPNRLNIDLDDKGAVAAVRCG